MIFPHPARLPPSSSEKAPQPAATRPERLTLPTDLNAVSVIKRLAAISRKVDK